MAWIQPTAGDVRLSLYDVCPFFSARNRARHYSKKSKRGGLAASEEFIFDPSTASYRSWSADVQLFPVSQGVEEREDEIVVTRNGEPAAVIINYDEYARLKETLDVLSDPMSMKQSGKLAAAIIST